MSIPARALAVGLGVGAALCVLLVLECALRMYGPGFEDPLQLVGDETRRDGMFRPHADRAYALAAGYRSSVEHAGTYALGTWPWRGRPAEPAPPGIGRVIVLGDSCVFGVGLEVADTLPERLAVALEERGFDRGLWQVLNLGVPGYSTVQVDRTLQWALETLEPDAMVLYVAAWNDQTPATGRPDAEKLARIAAQATEPQLAIERALRAAFPRSVETSPPGASPLETSPEVPNRTRVAAESVAPLVRGMLERARRAGCEAVVVAPLHPAQTELDAPRVVQDRRAVVEAAKAFGAPVVDAGALARADHLSDEELFVDFVHPAASVWVRVVPALADLLAERLEGHSREPHRLLRIGSVSPKQVPMLGDVALTIDLEGWTPGAATPAVTVGGAALLDVEVSSAGTLRGLVAVNRAGLADVLVQSAGGIAVAKRAVEFEPLRLERDAAGAIVLGSRPGDRATLRFASQRNDPPIHSRFGVARLNVGTLLPESVELLTNEVGEATAPLPASSSALFAQALVTPRGEPAGSREAKLTPLLEL